jgi:mono/diheme cytochrome c family protein
MRIRRIGHVAALCGIAASGAVSPLTGAAQKDAATLAHGKYIVMIAGCNDCHTPAYLLSDGAVPEEQWLTGDAFGWRGPWGTTYAVNLRNRLAGMDEDAWVSFARNLKTRPPMPWYVLHQMSEEDLRAVYRYVRHLGPAGAEAPSFVPPGQEPGTPYALFPSPPPAQ